MSNKVLKILGQEIKPGQSASLEMEVAKLHTRNSLRIPVIIERAKEDDQRCCAWVECMVTK